LDAGFALGIANLILTARSRVQGSALSTLLLRIARSHRRFTDITRIIRTSSSAPDVPIPVTTAASEIPISVTVAISIASRRARGGVFTVGKTVAAPDSDGRRDGEDCY